MTCANPSEARYRNGCRCAACREAHRIAQKRYAIDKRHGVGGACDPTEAREILRRLYERGFTQSDVKRGGVDAGSQTRLMDGTLAYVQARTLLKLRRLEEGPDPQPRRVDAGPVRRHLARWKRAGLTYVEIAKVSGVSLATVKDIANSSREHMRVTTLAKFARAQGRLDEKAEQRRREREEPKKRSYARKHISDLLSDWEVAECVWQLESGMRPEAIAAEHGIHPKTLRRILKRAKRHPELLEAV